MGSEARIHQRFTSGLGTNVTLHPPDSKREIPAQMVDVNRVGGVGLFVATETDFSHAPVRSLFGPWAMHRKSRTKDIVIQLSVVNVMASFHRGDPGFRLGGIQIEKRDHLQATQGVQEGRRAAGRVDIEPIDVSLQKKHFRIPGRLFNVSNHDGAGVSANKKDLGSLPWREIFSGKWNLSLPRETHQYEIKRVRQGTDTAIFGGFADDIAKHLPDLKLRRGKEKKSEDDEFLEFLDGILDAAK